MSRGLGDVYKRQDVLSVQRHGTEVFKTKLFMGIYWVVGHIGHWGVGYMYR